MDSIVGDVFFSLHVKDEEDPVYVSEVRERSAVSISTLEDDTPANGLELQLPILRSF